MKVLSKWLIFMLAENISLCHKLNNKSEDKLYKYLETVLTIRLTWQFLNTMLFDGFRVKNDCTPDYRNNCKKVLKQ